MPRPLGALAGLLLALLAGVAAPVPAAAGEPALDPHVALGVSAPPDASGLDGWVPESGVPWDYAYQYLAGGVNTGNGWQTWNEGGAFPLLYAERAAELGVTPVFSYYMLLQSNGPCGGCGEAERDLANLNSTSTMRAWFDDLTVLLQRLGPEGFGGRAVVHVEPDLSGYAQHAVLDPASCHGFCSGAGNDPANLRAAVASTGHPDLAGLPNTWVGFNQAVDRLRDRYAPNVELGFHFSTWSARNDVGRSTDPALDVDGLADLVAAFVQGSGAGDFELLFHDIADRDAAYYELVHGDPSRWWDRTNATFPNFARWERYVARVHDAVGKPVVVWQIPIGNQRMRTMDDTWGHYQDNKAEYLLTHVPELAASGIVALLFGRGADGPTSHTDAQRDGVTNPPPTCSTRGGGQACTSEVATVADDDGGFLRAAAAAYYAAPVPLGGGGACPSAGFADTAASVHRASIDCAAHLGIAQGAVRTGVRVFEPDAVTTRGQMATFLVRLLDRIAPGALPAAPPDQFDDDDGHLHEPSIDRLAAAGVVAGTGPRRFDPDASTSRGQMATFLAAAAEAAGQPLPSGPDAFADDDGTTHEAAVDAVAAAGIARGTGAATFSPAAPTRRGQMATFLVGLHERLAPASAGG